MDPYNSYPTGLIVTETVDDVTYRGHWFIDNQVIVLYVGSAGPLTKMVLGDSPAVTAKKLLREFLANELAGRRPQGAQEPKSPPGKSKLDSAIVVDNQKTDGR